MRQFPHIRVKGSAAERGYQIGQQAGDRIARSIDIYRAVFALYARWDWDQVVEHAARYRPAIEAYQPRYLEEIEGMAKGSGLDVRDLLAINARTEVMFSAVARQATKECTALVALPEATADGHTLIAQNWDWKPHMTETVIVLEVEQDEGPNYVTVVEAGLLAKTGFNSAGIGLVTNALVSNEDRGEAGVPYHVVLRGILDAETMSDALGAIMRRPRASSANYLIAHRDGGAINVEVAPGDYSRVYLDYPQDDLFVHTNHFTCSTFNLKDVTLWDWTDSPFRWDRMRQHLKRAHGWIGPEDLKAFFSDHFNQPDSICRHPDSRSEPDEQYATVVSVIMDLNAQVMWVADGNPCEVPYRELDYRALMDKQPAFAASEAE